MKIVIMGAGYVGLELLKSLQHQSHEIYITTTDSNKVSTLEIYGHVLVLHPTEDSALNDLIQKCDAMIILVAPKNSETYASTYLETAKRVTAALKNRKPSFYIIYTSSTSVFEGTENWVTEEMILFPKGDSSKILYETEAIYLNSEVDTCILRLGGIYGPQRELINRAKRFSGKEMTGTGNETTNHIHLDDIVAGINFCLNHRLKGIYHLVNDDHITRKELYSQLCESTALPFPVWNGTETNNCYKVANQKIKERGFIFKHPFLKTQ